MLMAFGMNVAAQPDFENKVYRAVFVAGDGTEQEVTMDFFSIKKMILVSYSFQKYKLEKPHISESLDEDQLIYMFFISTLDSVMKAAKEMMPYPESINFPSKHGFLAVDPKTGLVVCKIVFTGLNQKKKVREGNIYLMDDKVHVMFND